MLIKDHLSTSGASLFRWRSFILLLFVPFLILAAMQGEQVETAIGETLGDIYEVFAILLVILGQGTRIAAVGFVKAHTSGRNTASQVAVELNTTGLYSIVRNPLYLGNCLMYVGVTLFVQSLPLAMAMGLVLLPYYERIIATEEAFLADKFGQTYLDWASRTPAFVPRFGGWRAPAMAFSLRSVVRRETNSVYFAIMALFLIEAGLTYWGGEVEGLDRGWILTAAVATVVFVVLKGVKRFTRLLDMYER